MTRRRLIIQRLDPWSLMKFGFLVNLALLAAGIAGFAIVWMVITQLGLITTACEIAEQLGFQNCGINGGNLFRALVLLGLLGVIVGTGLLVFFSFLFNLIADLVGGVQATVIDEVGPSGSPPGGGRATGSSWGGGGMGDTRATPAVGRGERAANVGSEDAIFE